MKKEKKLSSLLAKRYLVIVMLIFAGSTFVFSLIYNYTTSSLANEIVLSYKNFVVSNIYEWLNDLSYTAASKQKVMESILKEAASYLRKNSYNFNGIDSYINSLTLRYDIDHLDYYIINPQYVIEYTNYSLDLGFDFKKSAPNFIKFLKTMKPGELYVSPISFETKTRYIRKYAYYKMKNGYTLEIGMVLAKNTTHLMDLLKNNSKYFPFLKNFDVFYKSKGFYKSLITGDQTKPPENLSILTNSKSAFIDKSKHTIYLRVFNKNLNLNIYASATLDFSSVYNKIFSIFMSAIFIFLLSAALIFLFLFSFTNKLVSSLRNISLKMNDDEYRDKDLETTDIVEFNYFIKAHNALVKKLNEVVEEEYDMNERLVDSLKELDLQKEKYKNLFNGIPNPAAKIKPIFDEDKNGKKTVKDFILLDFNTEFSSVFNIDSSFKNIEIWSLSNDSLKREYFDYLLKKVLYPSVNGKEAFDTYFLPLKQWFRIFSHYESDGILTYVLANIDEVKKMQLKLQENEEKLKMAMNAADEAVWEYDYKNDVLSMDIKGFTMLGYNPNDISGESMLFWKTLMHPEDRRRFIKVQRKLDEGLIDDFDIILRLRSKYGHYKWIEIVGKIASRSEDGKPAKMIGIRRDVNKKKEAEDRIKAAEERYRELINNTVSAIAVYKPIDNGNDFSFIYFNKRGCDIENVNKHEVVGKTLKELFPKAVEAGFLDIIKKVYEDGKPVSFLLHFVDDNGVEQWRDNYIFRLSTGEIVSVYQDITDQKNSQKTISLLSLALQNSKSSIYIADEKCNIVWANKEFEDVMGVSLKEVEGENVWEIYSIPKDMLKEIYQSLKTEGLWKGEIRIKDKSGKPYWERCFMSAIKEDGKLVNIVKVGEDITKQKEMEESLKLYATTDELTKVLNRRAGYLLLENEAKRSRRNKAPLTVTFVDMDNLKKINDTFGHEKGDEMIIEIVSILKSSIRDTDAIMRIGGDEFVVVFPESTVDDVESLFKSRVEKKIKDYNDKNKPEIPLSISYGFSQYDDFENPFDIEKILQEADDLMYEMKEKKKVRRK